MKRIFRIVQFSSYVATVVIAGLLAVMVARDFSTSSNEVRSFNDSQSGVSQKPPVQVTPVGKAVPMENVDWKEGRKTLVLYLSTTCKYCNESVPFYQRLVKENEKKGVKLVAVFSQTEQEAKEYLKNNKIDIADVRSGSFASIGIRGTPSVLLVDSEGVVSEYWRGRLQPDKENEVFAKLSS